MTPGDALLNLDLFIEGFVCVVALLISAFSLRTYLLTRQRKHFFFAGAFGLLAGGIALSALLNYFVEFEHLQILLRGYLNIGVELGYLLAASQFLVLSGFMTLYLVNSEIKDKRAIIMLYMMTFFAAIVAHEVYLLYHVTAFIIVGCVFSHYLVNYERQHTRSSLLVLLAFTSLLIAEAVLSFVLFNFWFYVIGNALRALGFVLFLIALIQIYAKR